MSDKLKELERELKLANAAVGDLTEERDEKQRRLRHAAVDKVDAEIRAEYETRITQLRTAQAEARKAFEAERVQLAETGIGAPAPIGTIMYEKQYNSRYGRGSGLAYTGKRARLEVFKAGDDFHGSRYRHPNPGDFILRFLKADGTPSKRAIRATNVTRTEWTTEAPKP